MPHTCLYLLKFDGIFDKAGANDQFLDKSQFTNQKSFLALGRKSVEKKEEIPF
jgi:hypothetical protein